MFVIFILNDGVGIFLQREEKKKKAADAKKQKKSDFKQGKIFGVRRQ